MKRLVPFLIIGMALAVSACSAPGTVTRDAPFAMSSQQALGGAPTTERVRATASTARDWRLDRLVVNVPQTLSVSEANAIKPRADIVWREDPIGNRHAQVAAVMEPALQGALSQMRGTTPVNVTLTVTRFHALTERTRYTFGGEHEIEFILEVRDAATGTVLRGPEAVDVTFRALGGEDAIASERQGIFQRDRIQARLSAWAGQEFGVPSRFASQAF